MANKTVGQLREEDRYHGDPSTSSAARARKTIDKALTSPSKYMSEAVSDTSKVMLKAATKKGLGMMKKSNGKKTARKSASK